MEEQRPPYRNPDRGVYVEIPSQTNHEDVVVRELDLGLSNCGDPAEIAFEPFREVINFELVESSDPDNYLTEFDPPVVLKVYYTKDDEAFAAEVGQTVAVAYCFENQWKRFTFEKHELESFPGEDLQWPGYVGYCRMVIEQWGDPSIFVGR
jgi:hypothetical protein